MNIPYTVETRLDTGVNNVKLGIWLFLASEVMLFGGLFSSYVLLRAGAPVWPHGYELLNVPLATFNTVVLITSSVTMVMSWASLKMNEFGKTRQAAMEDILTATRTFYASLTPQQRKTFDDLTPFGERAPKWHHGGPRHPGAQ
jgi:heme/copper-type cytochrome/quinol oxidase subunit 3